MKKSYEAQARIHREAFDDTNISLDSLVKALNDMQIGKAKTAIEIPVTTRGVGFLTNECYSRAIQHVPRSADVCDKFALYRVSLAQHQLQLDRSQQHHLLPDPSFHEVPIQDVSLEPSLAQEIQGMDTNFGLVADLINATGPVDINQRQYVPFVPKTEVNTEQTIALASTPTKRRKASGTRLVPDPYAVTFNNVRATVVALASATTPEAERAYFRRNNSIPGALFRDDNILENPDEIVPPGYARTHLKRDLRKAEAFFGLLGSKLSFMVGKCTFSGLGNPSQVGGYHQAEFCLDDGEVDSPEGTLLRYHEDLETHFIIRSALHLLGESPVSGLTRHPRHFPFRDPAIQTGYVHVDWSGFITRCLQQR